MQLGVRVRGTEEIAALEQLALPRETRLQAGDARIVDALRGLADREPFEHGARLQDLDSLVVGDAPHARAPIEARGRRARPARDG